jgi:hypothetical protein
MYNIYLIGDERPGLHERTGFLVGKKRNYIVEYLKLNIMQLPRGTFREIKKNETIESILSELERTRFTGICNISSGEATGTLVLNRGKCILVKFQGKSGDTGWDELQKFLGTEVDAALSTLDEAQVQLALEFNKTSKLVRGGKTATQPQNPAHAERPAHHEADRKTTVAHTHPVIQPAAPPVKPSPKPAAPAPAATRAPPPHKTPPVPEPRPQKPPAAHAIQPADSRAGSQIPPAPRAPAPRPEQAAPESEEDLSASGKGSFEKDIDTFDSMDLENVTDKIRNDCKTMIKQLHLEHLMER